MGRSDASPACIVMHHCGHEGGLTRSSPTEDELIQLMTKFKLLSDNAVLAAETPHVSVQPQPLHLVNKRMTLAFFDNTDAV